MNNILHDFNGIVISLVKKYLESMGNKSCLSDFTDNLNANLMDFGKNITEFVVKEAEELLFDSSQRKKDYISIDVEVRKLITIFGELNFARRYYKHKETGEKIYLLDKYLDINSRERILPNVEEKILTEATVSSYQKAGNNASYGLNLTKQTVKNKINKLQITDKIERILEKKKVKRLFIEADENHVHSQKGGIVMPQLVIVYEGKEQGKLINKKCFGGVYKNNAAELWEIAYEYIYATYDMFFLEDVYITGDCASWIKNSLNYIPKSKPVMDKFHFYKALRTLTGNDKDYMKPLIEAIYSLDFDKAKEEGYVILSEEMNYGRRQKNYNY